MAGCVRLRADFPLLLEAGREEDLVEREVVFDTGSSILLGKVVLIDYNTLTRRGGNIFFDLMNTSGKTAGS
jgi:hypothetical protein